jgi:hypothetical protein
MDGESPDEIPELIILKKNWQKFVKLSNISSLILDILYVLILNVSLLGGWVEAFP